MAIEIYTAWLTLMEHTYFASREVGIFYESEPLIGNYALTYALGLCAAPYNWGGPPRYKESISRESSCVSLPTFVWESLTARLG